MKQRQPLSGFGFIVLAIMIVMLATTFNRQNYNERITTQEFLTELETGNVASAVLKPNKETPTGELILRMKDGRDKQLYRSDVGATETLLLEHGIPYELENVPQENYLLTIVLPIIISAVVLVGLFALRVLKVDFGSVSGLLCGSMANPMALNYVNDTIEGDNPSVSYATVYPVCMFLRVIIIQVMLMLVL